MAGATAGLGKVRTLSEKFPGRLVLVRFLRYSRLDRGYQVILFFLWLPSVEFPVEAARSGDFHSNEGLLPNSG
jgi:hypothetical protein